MKSFLIGLGVFLIAVVGVALWTVVPWPVLLALSGFFLIVVLDYFRVRGAIIISILLVTALAAGMGLTEFTGVVSAIPSVAPTFMQMDFNQLFNGSMIAVIFVFFLVDLFDSTGTLVGVSHRAGLLVDGKLPRLKRALFAILPPLWPVPPWVLLR